MKNNILLVGGCGFIGHNLALYLKSLGKNPTIVDSLSINNLNSPDAKKSTKENNNKLYNSILNNRIKLIKKNNIKLILADTRFNEKIHDIYSNEKPDVIVHLAAVSHANKSNIDPHTTFDNSLRTLENSLDYAKFNKTHLIYLSSSMTYGNFNGKKVDEETICDPIGIYGTLKYCGELMVKSYSHIFEIPYTIIRPSALYGERCVSRRVTQVFIENAITNKVLNITGSGEEKLDFTYIDDLVMGISLCIDNEDSKNEIFNLTYGNSRKISELIDIIKDYFPKVSVKNLPRDKFMPERGTLDISKAQDILGYKPSNPIEKGYKKNIEWYIDFYESIKS